MIELHKYKSTIGETGIPSGNKESFDTIKISDADLI